MICELLTIHDILQTSLTVVAVVVVVFFCLFLLWVTDGAPYVTDGAPYVLTAVGSYRGGVMASSLMSPRKRK